MCSPACASVDVTECQEYNDTVTYGQLCVSIRHVRRYLLHVTFLNLLVLLYAAVQMTVFHQLSSVVLVTVCMETALMTPVIALRTQKVFTAKS